MQYKIKLLDYSYIDEQIIVYKEAFEAKELPTEIKERWIKKHYKNPIHDSYVFGAFDVDKLVSINAYMPLQYTYKDKKLNVIESCESATLRDYRGKGIWSQLVEFAVNYFKTEQKYDFLIGFPNYKNSFGGFIKMGWSHDLDVLNYMMIGNGSAFANCILKRPYRLFNLLNIQHIKLLGLKSDKYNIYEQCTDYHYNNDSDIFGIDKTRDFIKWKENYNGLQHLLMKNREGKVVGICNYSRCLYNNVPIIKLYSLETNVDNIHEKKEIYSRFIKFLIKKYYDVAFIRLWIMANNDDIEIYRKILFAKSSHPNPFITYQLKDDVISADELHSLVNWKNICFMDLD